MKQRIKSAISNTRSKKHPIRTAERKRMIKMKIIEGASRTTLSIIGEPEGEEREQEIENIFENIMTGNFPNLVKEIDIEVQKEQRSKTRCTQRGPH